MEELFRTMLNETNFPKNLWVDAVRTVYYVMNCVLVRSILKLTLRIKQRKEA